MHAPLPCSVNPHITPWLIENPSFKIELMSRVERNALAQRQRHNRAVPVMNTGRPDPIKTDRNYHVWSPSLMALMLHHSSPNRKYL